MSSQLGFRLVLAEDGWPDLIDRATGRRYARPTQAQQEAEAPPGGGAAAQEAEARRQAEEKQRQAEEKQRQAEEKQRQEAKARRQEAKSAPPGRGTGQGSSGRGGTPAPGRGAAG